MTGHTRGSVLSEVAPDSPGKCAKGFYPMLVVHLSVCPCHPAPVSGTFPARGPASSQCPEARPGKWGLLEEVSPWLGRSLASKSLPSDLWFPLHKRDFWAPSPHTQPLNPQVHSPVATLAFLGPFRGQLSSSLGWWGSCPTLLFSKLGLLNVGRDF